jgi:hypothetical protein
MRVLVIDVGGTHVLVAGDKKRVRVPSSRNMLVAKMVEAVRVAHGHAKISYSSIGCLGRKQFPA